MKYYLIAGEASGDLHGANLMKGLKKADAEAEFRFWGGDRMAAVGGVENLARHYKTTSFFGVFDILRNCRTIFRQMAECKRDLIAYAPDVLISIDYPGFNFRMAKFAHSRGIRTFYYISPKVWAWKESRVKLIRRYVDHLFIIFPFEVEYFRRRGIVAEYCGNPIMDSIEQTLNSVLSRREFFEANLLDDRPTVALLAGSRRSEIARSLPFMVALAREFPERQFVVAGVGWIDRSLYDKYLSGSGVKVVTDATYPLLRYSEAAIVTSGTATLETALIGTPEVVCYRIDGFSYRVARAFIKIRFISLVNIIMNRKVVTELIQGDMNIARAKEELTAILPSGSGRTKMLVDFDKLRRKVGNSGASERFAARMVEILKTEPK